MGLARRRLWVGQKRADLRRLERLVAQLKKWNERDYPIPFLTPAQLVILNSVVTNVTTPLLAATNPP